MKINTIKFTITMAIIFLIAFLLYGIIFVIIDDRIQETAKSIVIALCPILGMAIINLFRKPGS